MKLKKLVVVMAVLSMVLTSVPVYAEEPVQTKSKVEQLKDQIESAQDKVDKAQDELDKAQSDLDQAKEEVEIKQDELDKANEKLENAQSNKDSAESGVTEAQDELKSLEEELKQLEENKDQARDELEEAKKKAEQAQKEYEELLKEFENNYGEPEELVEVTVNVEVYFGKDVTISGTGLTVEKALQEYATKVNMPNLVIENGNVTSMYVDANNDCSEWVCYLNGEVASLNTEIKNGDKIKFSFERIEVEEPREIICTFSVGKAGLDTQTYEINPNDVTLYHDKDGNIMDKVEIALYDYDDDGDLDCTDLISIAHDRYSVNGINDLGYVSSETGDFYNRVWGVPNDGWVGYQINGQTTSVGNPEIVGSVDFFIYNYYENIDGYTDPVSEPSETDINDTEYIKDIYKRIQDKTSLSVSDWHDLYTLRKVGLLDEEIMSKFTGSTSSNTNKMKMATITGSEEYLDEIASTKNFIKDLGQYSADYALLVIDEEGYFFEGEELSVNLEDYAESNSNRDDAVYFILNTPGCWEGKWFTIDTGSQNAQALVAYYNMYPEVKSRLDEKLVEWYTTIMSEGYCDACSAGEYIKFASMMGDSSKAQDVLVKFRELGKPNWKFKGNAMDITRMARGEAATLYGETIKYKPSVEVEETIKATVTDVIVDVTKKPVIADNKTVTL